MGVELGREGGGEFGYEGTWVEINSGGVVARKKEFKSKPIAISLN